MPVSIGSGRLSSPESPTTDGSVTSPPETSLEQDGLDDEVETRVLTERVLRFGAATYKYAFRVLLMGESGVGKSALVQRVVNPEQPFEPSALAQTMGLHLVHQTFIMPNSGDVRLQIWDTGFGTYLDSIFEDYLSPKSKNALDAVIMCFDSTRAEIPKSVLRWLPKIRRINPAIVTAFVLTKCDLEEACQLTISDVRAAAHASMKVRTQDDDDDVENDGDEGRALQSQMLETTVPSSLCFRTSAAANDASCWSAFDALATFMYTKYEATRKIGQDPFELSAEARAAAAQSSSVVRKMAQEREDAKLAQAIAAKTEQTRQLVQRCSRGPSELNSLTADPTRSDFHFKFVILGPQGCGKSSFMTRLTDDIFDPVYTPTRQPEVAVTSVQISFFHGNQKKNQLISCKLWDFPANADGTVGVNDIGIAGAFILFDVGHRPNFEMLHQHVARLQPLDNPDIVMIIGTKCDRAEADREVTKEEASKWAYQQGLRYFETSAKTGLGVLDSLFAMCAVVHQQSMDATKALERQFKLLGRQAVGVCMPKWAARLGVDPETPPFTTEQLRLVFDSIDVESTGKVSVADLRALLRQLQPVHAVELRVTDADIDRVFKQFPRVSKDRTSVNFDQFSIILLRLFQK